MELTPCSRSHSPAWYQLRRKRRCTSSIGPPPWFVEKQYQPPSLMWKEAVRSPGENGLLPHQSFSRDFLESFSIPRAPKSTCQSVFCRISRRRSLLRRGFTKTEKRDFI